MAHMTNIMKEPCERCPFRADVRPFLTPERGEELAYATTNQYNSFTCHKTLVYDENDRLTTHENSKECAGFLSMQIYNAGKKTPEGFEPSDKVYFDYSEMIQVYYNPDEFID